MNMRQKHSSAQRYPVRPAAHIEDELSELYNCEYRVVRAMRFNDEFACTCIGKSMRVQCPMTSVHATRRGLVCVGIAFFKPWSEISYSVFQKSISN